MMWENFDEANHLLYKLYDFEFSKNIATGKHGKTMAQKKKEIAKRRKRKKN